MSSRVATSTLWFALKALVAISCFISGITVAMGVECSVESPIIKWALAVVVILAFMFALADFVLMKKALFDLDADNTMLQESNERLDQFNEHYKTENTKLEDMVHDQRNRKSIQKGNVRKLTKENDRLKGAIDYQENHIKDLSSQISDHVKNMETVTLRIKVMEENSFAMKMDNVKLKEHNEKHKKSVEKMRNKNVALIASLKSTEEKVAILENKYARSVELIRDLIGTADNITDLQKIIKENREGDGSIIDLLDAVIMFAANYEPIKNSDEINEWLQLQVNQDIY